MEGLRDGRAFVTSGPLVEPAVNEETPGGQNELPAGTSSVTGQARVRSITLLTRAWLVHNGREVGEVPLSQDRTVADFEGQVDIMWERLDPLARRGITERALRPGRTLCPSLHEPRVVHG
ncbi:MAG: hypothetical protein OXI46_08200 [Gemmatimonadota bacterium]|nr:hypothetical protein [Gemmatimonadota bacterium]